MVPVEPISLSIGIASLFSTCVECFDYFKAAQSLAKDLNILLVKLDIEKTRLLIWGNAIGILKVDENERAPALRDPPKAAVVEETLKQIKELLLGTEKLQKTYGLKPATIDEGKRDPEANTLSQNSMNDFRTSYKRFWVRNKASSGSPSLVSKTKWAIHDKAKFEDLRIHLKEFVDGLYHVLPISKDSQDRTIQGDICSILDINRLKLVKSACSESNYESWADMAREVIAESIAGTVDRRRTEEWLRDIADFEDEPITPAPDMSKVPFKDELSYKTRVKFVFTSECLNLQSTTLCTQNSLGTMVFDEESNFGFTPPPGFGGPWSLGRHINTSWIPRDYEDIHISEPLRVYVYCAPCSCLIHTAISLCRELRSLHPMWFAWVRPDDRLTASCCYEENRLNWLEALVEKSKEIEAKTNFKGDLTPEHLVYVDRTWVEQRIFDGEDDEGKQLSASTQDLRGILENHCYDSYCAAIIIIGELSHSAQLMRSPPFEYKGRPPKATQIYKFQKASDAGLWKAKFEGTYTPKNFTALATTKPPNRPLSDDLPRQMPNIPINAPKGPKRPRLNGTRSIATSARNRDYEGMEDLYDA